VSEITYDAPATVAAMMMSDALVRVLTGPVGSGKTTGMVMECARRMAQEKPDHNKIRKTRVAIVRNTNQQLRQTVMPEIEKWLMPAFRYKVTDSTLQFDFPLPDGTRVQSDWMLIPLDTPRDVQRLLSLNLSFAWVSEFREVPIEIIEALLGRVGRYRSLGVDESTFYGVMMESNMPDEDSAWYQKLEVELPKDWRMFKQPSGLDPLAENVENLRKGYYQDLIANNTEDWSDVYVRAQYGKSLAGQAVFRTSFKPDYHVVHETLKPNPHLPLMVGQDFGRTPASLIGQIDSRGRLVVFREITSVGTGIEQFAITQLRPVMFNTYAGMSSFMIGDPAGREKSQVGEESPFDCLKRLGFMIYPAPTNDIEPRLRAVEQMLLRQSDGGPMVLIDAANCPTLVTAMKSKYRYKRKLNDELDEKPDKAHPWSDVADCLQYMCLGVTGNYMAKVMRDSRARVRRPPVPVAGWT
jgi:hypothetical protein